MHSVVVGSRPWVLRAGDRDRTDDSQLGKLILYQLSYARVAANPIACAVKLADIADNADPTRLSRLDAATRDRLTEKYRQARAALAP